MKTENVSPVSVDTIIEDFEVSFPVERLRVEGVCIWPIIRNRLFTYLATVNKSQVSLPLRNEPKNAAISTFRKIIRRNIFRKAYCTRSHIAQLRRVQQSDLLFVSWPGELHVTQDNKRYCKYIDPYFEIAGSRFKSQKLVVEDKKGCMNDYCYSSAHLSLNCFKITNSKKITILYWNEFVAFFRQHTISEQVNLDYFLSDIRSIVHDAFLLTKFYSELLTRSKAKVVFFEEYYNRFNYALCMAANSLGIKTVEIQHGIIFYNYQKWNPANTGGELLFPQYICVWSKRDARIVEQSNSISAFKPRVSGNLSFIGKGDNLLNYHECFPESRNKKSILISLQTHISSLPQVYSSLFNMDGADQFYWHIRMHPLTGKALKGSIVEGLEKWPNVECLRSTDLPLDFLLPNIHCHLTESSSVSIEALKFGKRTIFVSDEANTYYSDLIAEKVFEVATDARQIFQMILMDEEQSPDKSNLLFTTETNDFDIILQELLQTC